MPADERDQRLARGMRRQLASREQLLDAGARHRGWKVGLTTAASRAAAGIDTPLIGFLTDATELSSDAQLEIGDWTRPTIEAEIAIRLGANVDRELDEQRASGAIAALAVAIEVVDLTVPLTEVEELLAQDIFHRRFVLGPWVTARAGGDLAGITVRAWLDDQPVATATDPGAVIGPMPAVVQLVARQLADEGLVLASGDVILAGSAIPLTPVAPGRRLRVEASGLGRLRLSFAAAPGR